MRSRSKPRARPIVLQLFLVGLKCLVIFHKIFIDFNTDKIYRPRLIAHLAQNLDLPLYVCRVIEMELGRDIYGYCDRLLLFKNVYFLEIFLCAVQHDYIQYVELCTADKDRRDPSPR